MDKYTMRRRARRARYWKRTWRNKVCALVLLGCGMAPILIDRDATAFVGFSLIAIPLFFAWDNWIY